MKIRKLVTVVEEIQEDGGRRLAKPLRKVAAVAVIENPFAGRYVEDLAELVKTGEELGDLLGRRAVRRWAGRCTPTARRRSWERTASTSTRRRSCIPRWGRRSAPRRARRQGDHPVGQEARRPRHHHRRAAALQGRGLRAHPLRRDGGPARRRALAPTRSWWPSSSRTAGGPIRGSAASPWPRPRRRTACDDARAR